METSENAVVTLSIVGDGLAGLMLATELERRGCKLQLFGDERSNTPPVGLMHLFAGRSFRRDALELRAFETAVTFWRREPLATEYRVRRTVAAGERLERTLEQHGVPEPYAPQRTGQAEVEYGPAFAVESQAFEARLRQNLGARWCSGRVEPSQLEFSTQVWAMGSEMADSLPQAEWDLSRGRVVRARCSEPVERVVIGRGLHLAPAAEPGTVVLGGRSSAVGPAPHDEIELAEQLTGARFELLSSWQGQRCAPAVDRRPALGWLDERRFVFCGFGSRALFWLPYCVEIACEALLFRQAVPGELQVERLFPAGPGRGRWL